MPVYAGSVLLIDPGKINVLSLFGTAIWTYTMLLSGRSAESVNAHWKALYGMKADPDELYLMT